MGFGKNLEGNQVSGGPTGPATDCNSRSRSELTLHRKDFHRKHLKVALPLALLAAASASAFAGPIVLNLSGLGDQGPILNDFNGGLGGNLRGPGPADGISSSRPTRWPLFPHHRAERATLRTTPPAVRLRSC